MRSFLATMLLAVMLAGCVASRPSVTASTAGASYLFSAYELSESYLIFETLVFFNLDTAALILDIQANKHPVERYVINTDTDECFIAAAGEIEAKVMDDCMLPSSIKKHLEERSGITLSADSVQAYLVAIDEWTERKREEKAVAAGPLERIR